MEVHHHSHTPGKKWTHYLWEFLMLFLAVFCGFLAENQREHMVEHQREKQYIHSMLEDLETDTANLNNLIAGFDRKSRLFDSLIRGFDEGVRAYDKTWAQQFLRSYRAGFPDFYPTDRTLQQLKNAGGLRLIRSEAAANGIIKYDAIAKDVKYEEEFVSSLQDTYIKEVLKVWSVDRMMKDAGVTSWARNRDMEVKNNYWITSEPAAFEHLFNNLSEFNESIIRHEMDYKELKENAIALISLLKKEYFVR